MAQSKAQAEEKIRHHQFETILTVIKAGEYPYLSGPTGSGKTTIGEQVAEDLGLEFAYIGAVESYALLKGFKDVNSNFEETAFTRLYQNGGVFLFDEIDASDPQAILTVNAAIANRKLDLPDGRIVDMHPDFKLIAAANTSGRGATLKYTGRQMLDAATLDRYIEIPVDYDPELEKHVAKKIGGNKGLQMLSLVHQARQASRDLQMDQSHDVSTRALVKGVNLMNAGMPIERAFLLGTMDKLGEESSEQLLAKIDLNLKDFELKATNDSVDQFRAKITETLSMIEQFEGTAEELAKLHADAEEIMTNAFETVSGVSAEIAKVRAAAESLKGIAKMAQGLDETTPAIREAVQSALDSIADGP